MNAWARRRARYSKAGVGDGCFEPAPDFRDTAGHLGEWTETSRITFGRDGVPFYVSGPYDNPRSVVRTLDRTCGEGNYHYVLGVG